MKSILIIAPALDFPGDPLAEHSGRWIVDFQLDHPDWPLAGLETSVNQGLALRFADAAEAIEFWRQISKVEPVRLDGKPNRPLTSFTVTIESNDA